MKKYSSTFVGALSSLLAVAGLFRMAERLDPLSQKLVGQYSVAVKDSRPGDNCSLPSMYSPAAITPQDQRDGAHA